VLLDWCCSKHVGNNIIQSQFEMCHSRKCPHAPHQWSSEIPRGWRAVQRPKVLKESTELNWNIGEEGVGEGEV